MSLAPEGRRLLRVEARNAEVPVERKPEWIKAKVHMGPEYIGLKNKVKSAGLHTVCEEAGCPNIFECWEDREATFLIGGDICTRRCDFCDITSGKPRPLDMEEPQKVAENIREMDLRYATVTVPELVQQVFDARPEVFAHNLETVPRIFKRIRPAFTYEKSLRVLTMAKADGLVTKSNLILGMGEEDHEIDQALVDLHEAGCDIITITQYVRPSKLHHPIDRWVKPQEFVQWSQRAEEIGFQGVMAGPLVRSSYRAGKLYAQAMQRLGRTLPENLAHLAGEKTARQEASAVVAQMS